MRTTTLQLPGVGHDVAAEVTMISISDPDVPDGAPIYEGLDPAAAQIDGSYPALLSVAQLQEPLRPASRSPDPSITEIRLT